MLMRIDQDFHHIPMPLFRGPHQGCLMLHRLTGIHIRISRDQRVDRLDTAGFCARHQRSHASSDRRVRVGAGFQKQWNQGRLSIRIGRP